MAVVPVQGAVHEFGGNSETWSSRLALLTPARRQIGGSRRSSPRSPDPLTADELVILVPLAGQKHDVSESPACSTAQAMAAARSSMTVAYVRGWSNPSTMSGNDLTGVLAARVVRRHDDAVGESLGNALWPLAAACPRRVRRHSRNTHQSRPPQCARNAA